MVNLFIKNTLFLTLFLIISCGNSKETQDTSIGKATDSIESGELAFAKANLRGSRPTGEQSGKAQTSNSTSVAPNEIIVGANQTEKYLPLLKGKRVGIITNPSGLLFKTYPHHKNESSHIVDSLLQREINVVKVFSPEHGFRGTADAGENIKDSKDLTTGLPIISLHGKNKKPTQEQLHNLDILLFDIQDVGVRFYTYISTLTYVIEAAAEKGIPIIVLDRPNPNAHYIDGPTLESCLLYTSPSPRDLSTSRMPSSA